MDCETWLGCRKDFRDFGHTIRVEDVKRSRKGISLGVVCVWFVGDGKDKSQEECGPSGLLGSVVCRH